MEKYEIAEAASHAYHYQSKKSYKFMMCFEYLSSLFLARIHSLTRSVKLSGLIIYTHSLSIHSSTIRAYEVNTFECDFTTPHRFTEKRLQLNMKLRIGQLLRLGRRSKEEPNR